MSAPENGVLVPAGRGHDGRFGPGNRAGATGGWTAEKRENLRSIARLAQDRSRRSLDRLTELMESDDERVALGACTAILKAAGAFDQANDSKIEEAAATLLARKVEEARAKREQDANREHRDPAK